MKFQFLPENFSRSENAPPFETRKIRHFEVERIFLENKKMLQEIVEKVLQLAKSNPDWGYEHIAGTMRYLGYNVSATTIRHILEVNGIVPDPERRLRGDWSQFIETQQYVTTSTDFAQVERLTPFGLVRESLLFFMDIGSREVCLGGIVHNPDSNWTTQIARNMCDMWDGFMLGKKYLIHDRDPLFNKRFDAVFESVGIEIKKLPPFTPEMNARMENFIRAIKTECLNKIIFTSEWQLRLAVKEYLEYWNHYRPHAGLGGKMVKPYPQDMNARSERFHFLVACFTVIDGNRWRREHEDFMHPRYARVRIFALVRKK